MDPKAPYAGVDDGTGGRKGEPEPPDPFEADRRRRVAEDEVRKLKATVKAMESALRTAAKVMQPYLARSVVPSDTAPLPRRSSWVR